MVWRVVRSINLQVGIKSSKYQAIGIEAMKFLMEKMDVELKKGVLKWKEVT